MRLRMAGTEILSPPQIGLRLVRIASAEKQHPALHAFSPWANT